MLIKFNVGFFLKMILQLMIFIVRNLRLCPNNIRFCLNFVWTTWMFIYLHFLYLNNIWLSSELFESLFFLNSFFFKNYICRMISLRTSNFLHPIIRLFLGKVILIENMSHGNSLILIFHKHFLNEIFGIHLNKSFAEIQFFRSYHL